MSNETVTRWIVFERPAKSRVWTIAFKHQRLGATHYSVPAQFLTQDAAEDWVGKQTDENMQHHIASVALPV
jgi:hypothetical protein